VKSMVNGYNRMRGKYISDKAVGCYDFLGSARNRVISGMS